MIRRRRNADAEGGHHRRLFRDAVEHELARSRRHNRSFAIVWLRIADTGHHRGLDGIAGLIRETDLGWSNDDETVVLLPETDQNGVDAFVDRIAEEPTMLGADVRVGAAVFPDDGLTLDHLLTALERSADERSRSGARSLDRPLLKRARMVRGDAA